MIYYVLSSRINSTCSSSYCLKSLGSLRIKYKSLKIVFKFFDNVTLANILIFFSLLGHSVHPGLRHTIYSLSPLIPSSISSLLVFPRKHLLLLYTQFKKIHLFVKPHQILTLIPSHSLALWVPSFLTITIGCLHASLLG